MLIYLCIFLLSSFGAFANDGIVISVGDTIHPVDKTLLEIHREDLKIEYQKESDDWKVDVTFYIYNPTSNHLLEKIAFVNKASPFQEYKYKVSDFSTKINGSPVTFQLFEKQEESEIGQNVIEYYTSEVDFYPGYTRIDHSFRYYGSIGWGPDRRGFVYLLETAKKWNGPIRKFNVDISLPENSILLQEYPTIKELLPYGSYIKKDSYSYLGKYANWKGIMIKRGGFFYSSENYVPAKNLILEFYDFDWYLRNEETIPGKKVGLRDMMSRQIASDEVIDFTTDELRLLRNSIFAWHGYRFSDKALESYFSRFIWYSSSQQEQIFLSSVEKANVEMLLSLEKKN